MVFSRGSLSGAAAVVWLFLLGIGDAALIQNGITYANADFVVTFYEYNITGFINVTVFESSLYCKVAPSSLAPGGIMLVFWPDAQHSSCTLLALFLYALSEAASDPTQLPAVVIFVQDTDNENADDWQLPFANKPSDIILTSIRATPWSQLSLDLPITITPGPNVWQTMLLSNGTRARLVFFACVWSIVSLLFLCALFDIVITLVATTKRTRSLWVELNVSGLLFSLLTTITYAYSAALSFQNSNLSGDLSYSFFSFSMIPIAVSVYSVSIKWLQLLGESKKLPTKLVKINAYVLLCMLVATVAILFTLGVFFCVRLFPRPGPFYISGLAIIGVGILTIIFIISYCFVKIWASVARSFRETGRAANIWKLAFVSIGSVLTLLLLLIFIIVSDLISSVDSYITLEVIKALCPLPMLASWLSLSNLWTNLTNSNRTQGSSTGRSGSESEAESKKNNPILLIPESEEELKPTIYSVGDITVSM